MRALPAALTALTLASATLAPAARADDAGPGLRDDVAVYDGSRWREGAGLLAIGAASAAGGGAALAAGGAFDRALGVALLAGGGLEVGLGAAALLSVGGAQGTAAAAFRRGGARSVARREIEESA